MEIGKLYHDKGRMEGKEEGRQGRSDWVTQQLTDKVCTQIFTSRIQGCQIKLAVSSSILQLTH